LKVYLSNHSTVETDATIKSWIPGLQSYAGRVASWWGHGCSIVFGDAPTANEWQIRLMDDSDQQGALGYHDYTPSGKPISYVFLRTDRQYGYSETVTLTHELAEMQADAWISLAMQTSNTRFYAVEVGDPVEQDNLGFTITPSAASGGVPILCSDFALPGWFIPSHPGPYDYKHHCTHPLQVLAGGYAQYFENGWHQVGPSGEHMSLEPSTRFRNRR
jgi:hypothetical protein